MKVTPAALPPVARDHARSTPPGHARFTLNNATPAVAGNPAENTAAPASPAARLLPPGLERVMTRLESMPTESRNHGQVNAFERISRNIARYQEHHGVPAPVDSGTPPVTETPAETPAVPVAPVAETPAAPVETPPEAPVATPPEATAEVPTATPGDGAAGPVAEAPVAGAPVVEAPAVAAPIVVEAPIVEGPAVAAPVAVATPVEAATPVLADTPVAGVADAPLAVEVPVVVEVPPAGSLIDVQA